MSCQRLKSTLSQKHGVHKPLPLYKRRLAAHPKRAVKHGKERLHCIRPPNSPRRKSLGAAIGGYTPSRRPG